MVRHIPTCSPEKEGLKETIQPLHFTQGQPESEEPTVKAEATPAYIPAWRLKDYYQTFCIF